jgi:hypothetical protein
MKRGRTKLERSWNERRRRRVSALMIVALLLVSTANAAYAQAAERNAVRQFNIPSQPLESALEAFSAASGLQLLYETALTAARHSADVRGTYTQEAALRRLLSGTGLDFTYTEERAFTLVPVRSPAPGGQAQQLAEFNPFLGSIQAGVMAALCRRPETRPGEFRIAMQFWVGGSGKIENPRLLNSTGSSARDAAITDVLTHVALGQVPPAGMPQPVTMVLKAGPASRDDDCGAARR